MTITKPQIARIALLVAATVFGGLGAAYAADLDWYSGGNATVADPDSVTTLKFYDASGTAITSGSTTDKPFVAFAAADDTVRTNATHGTLFAYTPSAATAPGAWSGAQISGTTKFDAVTAPGAVAGKQFHQGADDDWSLSDYIGAYPNSESGSALKDVYELRFRPSASDGVDEDYASAFVKVSGDTWTQVSAPTLGGQSAVGTSVTLSARAITYGSATTIPAKVTQASGSAVPVGHLELYYGATKLGSATASSSGLAYIAFSKTALLPGTKTLTVKFVPTNADDFTASQGSKAYTIARRAVATTFTFSRYPTSTVGGLLPAKVTASSGLPVPTGTVTLQYKRAGTSTIKSASGTLSAGKKTLATSKLPKGQYWEFRVKYNGSSRYLPGYSAWKKILIRS